MESIEFKKEIESIFAKEKALSYSALKAFLNSPRHFYKYKTDKETTKAMEDGKIFHMATLEPEKFKSKYWVLDDSEKCSEIGGAKPRGTKAYKEWLEEELSKHEWQKMIPKDEYDNYISMSEYLRINPATKELMNGLIETEKPFEYEYNDFLISGKIDGVGKNYKIDLKKVADSRYKKVKWIIEDMMYDLQAAIYCLSDNIFNYYLIFIDTSCNVTVVKITKDKLSESVIKFDVALSEFTRCAEEDLFYSSYEFFNGNYINY